MKSRVLPAHLRCIEAIVADAAVAATPLARRVRERLPGLPFRVLGEGEKPGAAGPGQLLYLKYYRGRFFKFCPGTSHYRCCAYRIAHIGENCPLSCTYCILQVYFQDRVLKVWANQEDLFGELGRIAAAAPGKRFRVGTGEFTDSLALEAVTGMSRDLVDFLGSCDNVCLELKSKVVDLSWMEAVRRPDRVLPAWSLNSPQVHAAQERGTASLEDRLAAARECAGLGFRVCLHFDPVILHPGWEAGYARTVEMLFDYLRPEQLAYLSLGSFRSMPRLFEIIAQSHPQATYIHDEYVPGLDGKLRLLRPLRVRQLRYLAGLLQAGGLRRQLYLCMESDQVWQAVLGTTPGRLGGLGRLLMDRAFGTDR